MSESTHHALRLSGTITRGEFSVAVDFSVAPGEVVALSGPNGVGKTTVLRSLAGLGGTLDTAGTYTLGGEDMTHLPPEQRRLAVVF